MMADVRQVAGFSGRSDIVDMLRQNMRDGIVKGKKQDYFKQVIKLLADPKWRDKMAIGLWQALDSPDANVIAGQGYAGVALATVISEHVDVKLLLFNSSSQNYGLGSDISGHEPRAGDRVAIVDDVFKTGFVLRQMGEAIEKHGATVAACAAVVLDGEPIDFPYKLRYLTTTRELRGT